MSVLSRVLFVAHIFKSSFILVKLHVRTYLLHLETIFRLDDFNTLFLAK